jgi:hypothetical protein
MMIWAESYTSERIRLAHNWTRIYFIGKILTLKYNTTATYKECKKVQTQEAGDLYRPEA